MIRALVSLLVLVVVAGCGGEAPIAKTPPHLELAPTELDFGTVLVGRAGRRAFEVRNLGRTAGQLQALELPAGFRIEPEGVLLQPGEKRAFELLFLPEEQRSYDSTILFDGKAAGQLALQVTAAGSTRAVEAPEVLDFGTLRMGEMRRLPLDVVSRSDAEMRIESVFAGTQRDAFDAPMAKSLLLPPGGTGRLFIEFTPMQQGVNQARIELRPCAQCEPVEVRLTGRGSAEAVAVQPTLVDFGVRTPGAVERATVHLTNAADQISWLVDARIVQEAGGPFRLVPLTLPAEIDRAAVPVSVEFAPTRVGTFEAKLRLQVADGSVDVPLRAEANGPQLSFSPEILDFDVVRVGSAAARTLHMENPLGDEVSIVRAEFVGRDADLFSTTLGPLPSTLRGVRFFDVQVVAQRAGSLDASLRVTARRGEAEVSVDVPLRGDVAAADAACVLDLAPRLGVGPVAPGSQHVAEVVAENVGPTECWVWDARLEGSEEFSMEPTASRLRLPPGQVAAFPIRFAPTENSSVASKATLSFRALGLGLRLATQLEGWAYAPLLAFEPPVVDFGEVPAGEPRLQAVVIRNLSRDPVPVSELRLQGSGLVIAARSDFSRALGPGESFTFHLLRRPEATGTTDGTVELHSPLLPVPLRLPVSGTTGEACVDCEALQLSCPAVLEAFVHHPVELFGHAVGPLGSGWLSEWYAPAPHDLVVAEAPRAAFVPEFEGVHLSEFRVWYEEPDVESCTTSVFSENYPGFWIDAIAGGDVLFDLHLLHESAGDPASAASYFGHWDAWRLNPTPAWDEPGRDDDPLLVHESAIAGVEQLRLPSPVIGTDYTLALTRREGIDQVGSFELSVDCAGTLHPVLVDLQAGMDTALIGTLRMDAAGSCSFTQRSEQLELLP